MYGDSAYASQKKLIEGKAPKAKDFTNQRTRRNGIVDEALKAKNRNKSRIRSRVDHVFGVVKRLRGLFSVTLIFICYTKKQAGFSARDPARELQQNTSGCLWSLKEKRVARPYQPARKSLSLMP